MIGKSARSQPSASWSLNNLWAIVYFELGCVAVHSLLSISLIPNAIEKLRNKDKDTVSKVLYEFASNRNHQNQLKKKHPKIKNL